MKRLKFSNTTQDPTIHQVRQMIYIEQRKSASAFVPWRFLFDVTDPLLYMQIFMPVSTSIALNFKVLRQCLFLNEPVILGRLSGQ